MSREMFVGIEVIRVPLVAHGTALNWLIRASHFLRVLGLTSLMDMMKVLGFLIGRDQLVRGYVSQKD